MLKIFISYRRADSGGWVTAIYKELIRHFDPAYIFRDIDTIDYGIDFVEAIEDAVQQCDVLLTVIGPHWNTVTDDTGQRRLDDPRDFVRLEIKTALTRNIRVIPILVGGAAMPYTNELPADLQALTRRNALEIEDRDFDPHVERLVRALQRIRPQTMSVATPAPHVLRISDLLPLPFEWVEIPAGEITLENASSYGGTTGGRYDVPSFVIAKYPITNAQFQVFVTAQDGYGRAEWWGYSGEAQTWRENNPQPQNAAFSGDDLPRTNVCWYEAIAFCCWLSEKMGEPVTLPTEQQWQRAAQGDDGRKYPWGNAFDRQLCNFNSKAVTPVTHYSSGASPYGIMDMSGNVLEWCLTKWGINDIDVESDSARVLRGGSWWSDATDYLRAAYRFGGIPGNGYFNFGFRCARSVGS